MDKDELLKLKEKLMSNQDELLNIIENEIKKSDNENNDLVITSFWEIFHNDKNITKKILIPNIQRNYVQGNDEKIRDKLIKDIFDALKDERKKVNFDIIYGINNGEIFVPIDGQQRLTTLFLLYWYIFLKNPKNGLDLLNEIDLSYENRASSKEFFELLKNENNFRNIAQNNQNNKISKKIKDCTNYYSSKWSKDITIQASLKMLDKIEEEYKEICKRYSNEEICNILTNKKEPRIFFRCKFLEAEVNNVAELYIKMNSRGKKLSDYEILKSQLENIAFTYKNSKEYIELCAKFDNDWADIFLHKIMRNEKDITRYAILEKVEKNYYKFLEKFLMFYFIDNFLEIKKELYENEEEYEKEYEKEYREFKTNIGSEFIIKFQKYGIYLIKEDFFDKLENIMKNIKFLYSNNPTDECKNIKEIIDLEKLWEINIEEKERNLREELYFYAIIKFLENKKLTNNLNQNYELFANWIRVIRNYINSNYHIQVADKNPNDSIYFKIIRNIKTLINGLEKNDDYNIVNYIKDNLTEKKLFNLSSNERLWLKTEILKSNYYMTDANWKKLIIEADKDEYFKGVNYFLFDFIKNVENKIEEFRKYKKIVKSIFKDEIKNEFLLQRAMLSKEVYFRSNNTFYVFSHGDNTNTWIYGLNEKQDENNSEIYNKFKAFIDKYIIADLNFENIDTNVRLNEIINNSKIDSKDWRYYFINEPRLFEICNQGLVEASNGNLEELDANKEIYLIKTQRNSKHWDYLTLLLYNKLTDLKLNNVIIKYIGKTGTTPLFEYNQNLKIIYNGKEYTFIRNLKGKYMININNDNEKIFSFRYNITINERELNEKEFNRLNKIIGNNSKIEIVSMDTKGED